ncbi:hypothetical protein [Bradyrhizobium sp. 6(2017)]|uniref:hypothetical protein n=1 Tax=Bradyrhizobium sp. 6(2017) TaxID=1197460 RepID=UPI002FE66B42
MHLASTPGRRDLPLRIDQTATTALISRFALQYQGQQQVGDFVSGIVGGAGPALTNIMAALGHTTLAQAEKYTREANRKRGARINARGDTVATRPKQKGRPGGAAL